MTVQVYFYDKQMVKGPERAASLPDALPAVPIRSRPYLNIRRS